MTDPESGSSLRYLAHSNSPARRYIVLTARQTGLICLPKLIITKEPPAAANDGSVCCP
jgi:hypothetical protein